MEPILQSLMELSTASPPCSSSTRPASSLGHRGHTVYDQALCEQVSAALAKALDAVQLQQEDWETVTAHFADGKLVAPARRRERSRTTSSRSWRTAR